MSRPKFEDQFRTEMQNREIKPSAKSWEELQERLEETRKDRVPTRYWWRGVAAVIGGVAVASLMFTQDPVDNAVMVGAPEIVVPEKRGTSSWENEQMVWEQTEGEKGREEPGIVKPLSGEEVTSSPNTNRALATAKGTEKKQKQLETPSAEIQEEIFVEQNMSELLGEVSPPESQTMEVTDAEIDALLARADEEISREQRIAANPDADDLLQIVETELEQSFRAKVFDILKKGFQKTRTAVVNRNHSSQ